MGTDDGHGFLGYHAVEGDTLSISSNIIITIAGDNHIGMWIGTDRGLIRFCAVSGDWRLFSESDGLPSAVFNRAAVKRRDGTLVFGTKNGMTVIKPNNFNDDTDAVNVRISFIHCSYHFSFARSGQIYSSYIFLIFSILSSGIPGSSDACILERT